MRVTQGMMANNVLRNIGNGYSKVADYQEQLSSGKKITRPSQDPVVAMMGIAYRTDVTHVEQYQRNVSTAYKWLDSADDALDQTNDVLTRIRELTDQASNGTYTSDQRTAMAQEVDELTQHLATLANTQVGGQYIFSGSDTANPLIKTEAAAGYTQVPGTGYYINQAAKDNPAMPFDVNDGIEVSVNANPNDVFTNDMFSELDTLKEDLQNGSSSSVLSGHLSKIDGVMDGLANAQADLGAKTNRLDLLSNRLDAQKTIATKIMSTNEDADYAETIVNLNQQQNVYNASLSVGARIIQTSLVDFLQ